MKAIRVYQYGNANVLQYEEMPGPIPQADEVLILVHAAGINPIDWKIREGQRKEIFNLDLPYTPGSDVAGVVIGKGDQVQQFEAEDQVYAFINLPRQGAYAEHVVVKESEAALKPKSVDYKTAAIVPLSGLTAWQALFDVAKLEEGQSVLIHGAAGGVGHFAVQLAKWKKAYVVGTASEKNQAFLKELGVDEFIDYQAVTWSNYENKFDVILDTVGGETLDRSWVLLKKSGILVTIVDPSRIENRSKKQDVRGAYCFVTKNQEQLTKIAKLIDEGIMHPHVSLTYPLAEAKEAQMFSQSGHVRGKLALSILNEGA